MEITSQTIARLAELSRLCPSAAESELLAKSLGEMIQYIDQIRSLDLTGVAPMMRVDETIKELRPDEVRPGLTTEQAFANAPAQNMGHFSIPKTVH